MTCLPPGSRVEVDPDPVVLTVAEQFARWRAAGARAIECVSWWGERILVAPWPLYAAVAVEHGFRPRRWVT